MLWEEDSYTLKGYRTWNWRGTCWSGSNYFAREGDMCGWKGKTLYWHGMLNLGLNILTRTLGLNTLLGPLELGYNGGL